MAHILLCEDDLHLRNNIAELLSREDHCVITADCAESCRRALRGVMPDLVVLDVLHPDGNGFELCGQLRKSYVDLPILMLTCCDREEDVLQGFASGADDYVEKPFRARVLISRIEALLRRCRTPSLICSLGGLFLDRGKRVCRADGVDLNLTPSEFLILWELAQKAGKTVPREDLVHTLWALDSPFVDENTVFVHMSRLRTKLGPRAEALVTLRGEGYVLEVEKL